MIHASESNLLTGGKNYRNAIKSYWMKKYNSQQIFKVAVILFFIGFGIYFIVNKIYETEMLKGAKKELPALLMEIRESSSKSSKKALVQYKVNGNKYEFYSDGDYLNMSVGDTVLIEYSVKDPSIAEVVNLHYMKKNR